jgi:hypothetical protein
MLDRDGLDRARVMCGTLQDALGAQRDALLGHPALPNLGELDDAINALVEAESALDHFLEYTRECAVCDGIIGAAPRAEVVMKDDPAGSGEHYFIHQDCFRENQHEIA